MQITPCREWYHPQDFFLRETKKTNMSIKSTIAAVAASPFLLAGAAFAGPYVNVETVSSYTGDDYTGLSTEFQIGFEGE